MTLPIVLGVLVFLIPALGVYWTLARNADQDRLDAVDSAPPIGDDPAAFLRALHGAVGAPASDGNDVRIYQNGDEIFPALVDAIRGARDTVHFATYVYWAGAIPDSFATLFADTARRGVRVRVVIDGEGASPMDPRQEARMREAGCEIGVFHPARWYSWTRYNHRLHRRLLIVDGTVGFTGGVGIADEWSGDARGPNEWRDTHARVTGPAVAALQSAFAQSWNECTDELLLNARDYPALEPAGAMTTSVVVSTPSGGSSAAQRTMAAVIAGATRTLRVTNAYFVPTPGFVDALCAARARGVAITILVPGPHIDMKVVRWASRHCWPALLAAGVEIHEFQPAMIHAKTLVADGQLSLIGSVNFDPRSFALNRECALVVSDVGLAAEMERVFDADLQRATRVRREDVAARGPFARLRDATAYWLRAQL